MTLTLSTSGKSPSNPGNKMKLHFLPILMLFAATLRAQPQPFIQPLLPTPNGNANSYLNGTLNWSTPAGGGGTNAVWGGITGNLGDQTDLLTELTNKVESSALTNYTGNLSGPFTSSNSLLFDGDSLTATANPDAYASILGTVNSFWGTLASTNYANAGDGLVALSNRWTSTVSSYVSSKPSGSVIFTVWVGVNDYSTVADPYTTIARMSNYWTTAKAAGVKLVAFTITPRETFSGLTDASVTNLFLINQYIRSSPIWDYLIDANAMFPNCYDTLWYESDAVHLTDAAQHRIAQEWDHVLRSPPRNLRWSAPVQVGTNYYDFSSTGFIRAKSNPSASLMTFYNATTAPGVVSSGNFQGATTTSYLWSTRSRMSSPADGHILFMNAASSDFSFLKFGGTSSSFPSIKRNSAGLDFRLADDSAYTTIAHSGETITGGTVTADTPVINASQTWNNAGVTFTGLKLNVTNTASASASLIYDIQLGGTTKHRMNAAGVTAISELYGLNSTGDRLLQSGNVSFRALGGFPFADHNSGFVTTLDFSEASNTLSIGRPNSSPASSVMLKAQSGSGTDKNGAALVLAGGKSTGTGRGGGVIVQTTQTSTTSSTANSYTERFHAPAKSVDLTESTATTLFTIPVAAANYVGLTATVTIFASDGTDHQSLTSQVRVDAVAKTTTITPTVTQTDNTTAASSGTLTCTYTVTDDGSNVMAVKANAVSSLTQTTLRAKIVVTAINSNGTAALTEQ